MYIEEIENIFNTSQRSKVSRNKNLDIQHTETISFVDSLHGCKKTIKIKQKETCYSCKGSGASLGTKPKLCWTCNGKGKVQYRKGPQIVENECDKCKGKGVEIKSKCGACSGEGMIFKEREEMVDLPGYLKSGAEIVFSGRGHTCEKTKKKGNLILQINVEESEIFERKGPHIFSEIEISFAEGMVGSSLLIETIWGRRKVNFKGLTKTNHLMTLPKYGIYNYEKKTYGNHYVNAKLVCPKLLTPEMEQLYKELDTLGM
mgnify:CR=1 FL=1